MYKIQMVAICIVLVSRTRCMIQPTFPLFRLYFGCMWKIEIGIEIEIGISEKVNIEEMLTFSEIPISIPISIFHIQPKYNLNTVRPVVRTFQGLD